MAIASLIIPISTLEANLLEACLNESAGLVNWGLTSPSEVLRFQIKKGISDIDAFIDDPYLGFIKNKLVPDPNGFIGSLEIESEVTSYFEQTGYNLFRGQKPQSTSAIIKALLQE